ncbi:proton channel OtopLc-like [Antedon mediterranea]|uniref:proton channel OtopLc-like n=1 Tax=Antedon mediterranea TaxID=105859 RepID=UPI003AF5DCD3
MQSIYLKRFSKTCFQRFTIINRFAITQILVTNLSHWVLLISYETYVDYKGNITGGGENYEQALPYLMDCTIEYCLIAAVLLANMWHNIGLVPKEEIELSRPWKYSIMSSIYGIAAGVVVVIAVSVIGSFLVQIPLGDGAHRDGNAIKTSVYLRIILATAAAMCSTFCAFCLQFSSVEESKSNRMTQDTILLFWCCGFHALLNMYSLLASLVFTNKKYRIAVWDSIMCLIGTLSQSTFVIFGLISKSVKQNRKRIVQNILIFLSITNLSQWMLSHYELRIDALFYPLERTVYGNMSWYLLHHVTGPIVSFYYFHSATCLFEIWIAVSLII